MSIPPEEVSEKLFVRALKDFWTFSEIS